MSELNRTATALTAARAAAASEAQRCADLEAEAAVVVESSRQWYLRLTVGLLMCTAVYLAWPFLRGAVRC